jgi:azurin
MKLFSLLCVLVLVSGPAAAQSRAGGPAKSTKEPRTIEITGTEKMAYSVTSIAARPGEQLHVVLKAVGTMPKVAMAHNFVLLKQGASPLEVNNAAFTARDTAFIPPSMKDKILVASGLAGAGETVEVTFAAPGKPGTYTYLCTFPGHFAQGMKGQLIVK